MSGKLQTYGVKSKEFSFQKIGIRSIAWLQHSGLWFMICSYLVSGSGIGIMFSKSIEELEMDGFSSFIQAFGSHHLKERKAAEKPIILIQ
jgi:uncharacterized membrane protein